MKLKLPFVPSKSTWIYLFTGIAVVVITMVLLHLFSFTFELIAGFSSLIFFLIVICVPCIVIYIGKKKGI